MASISRSGFLLLFVVTSLRAQQGDEKQPLIIKATENFDISGKGDAAAWKTTDWVLLQKRKGDADYITRVKLLYSSTGIYALYSCDDTKITATFDQDFADLWTEDVIEIFFWPDESSPLYFEYELSPLNHELVLLVPNYDGDFLGWRPWHYEAERKTRHAVNIVRDKAGNPIRWTGEFFIPYALLKPLQQVPPKKGMEWRANLYRIDHDHKNSTSWVWKPVEKNFHDFHKFGVIRFE